MAGGGEATADGFTPTWVVAVVYTVIVGVSYGVERLLHRAGERLKEKQKTALYEALQKIKEELMLLGFISLLLTVSEKRIVKICVSPGKKVPLISLKAIHDLHIFIFTLAIVHVIYCVLTVFIGKLKIRHWRYWRDSTAEADQIDPQGRGTYNLMTWLHCFWKQFCGSVNESDYVTLRREFMKANPMFNFHKYMIEALEVDFIYVFGISWYLWIFVVIFFLINVNGWYTYFWIAFIPLILLLAVGTKLEHVLMLLVRGVDASNADDHFWFRRPSFVLLLIHFILFQNSFEIAFFFWTWTAYSPHACVMGQFAYVIVRLVIGVFIQVLCSYNTLPLYSLLTQMGEYYCKEVFLKHQKEAEGGKGAETTASKA
ncbi:MLO-like protein 15 [Neltuma alba]|uniref:MLO-like protein 15 n=1 Tax=Neltuma alba TaxID=207710 RepID=UPI0010A4A6A0|nr:MLO-like protein 15 [Prosopis alba]